MHFEKCRRNEILFTKSLLHALQTGLFLSWTEKRYHKTFKMNVFRKAFCNETNLFPYFLEKVHRRGSLAVFPYTLKCVDVMNLCLRNPCYMNYKLACYFHGCFLCAHLCYLCDQFDRKTYKQSSSLNGSCDKTICMLRLKCQTIDDIAHTTLIRSKKLITTTFE